MPDNTSAPFDWREHLPVHPAANEFPLLSETDPQALKELAADIEKHGLQEPIPLYDDQIIDGRNRLDALALLGWLGPKRERQKGERVAAYNGIAPLTINYPQNGDHLLGVKSFCYPPDLLDDDAVYAYVVSHNLHRRHLTPELKRDLIVKLLRTSPEKSDRAIAKEIGASPTTVGKARDELSTTGQLKKNAPRVGLDGKARKQPSKKSEPTELDALQEASVQAIFKCLDEVKASVQKAIEDIADDRQACGVLFDQLESCVTLLRAEAKRKAEKATRATKLPKLNPDGVSVAGCTFIYAPADQALEYAPLSANPYRGCGHGCAYCYVPHVIRMPRKEFDATATPRSDYLEKLKKDAAKYETLGITEQVMLSFTTDVYNPINSSLTRPVIQILRDHGLGFCVLTKGGSRALADIDLYRRDRDAFASTLTSLDDHFSKKWERNAALPGDRIETLKAFHDRGIFTWVSLEPTIDCDASIEIVRATHSFIDLFKVGRVNHDKMTKTIDWEDYTHRMIAVLNELGAKHYIKKDLQPYLPPNYPNPLRVPQHHDAASLVAEAA